LIADVGSFFTATLAKQLPGINDTIIDSSVIFRELKKAGKITYNCGGDGIEWRMRISESTIGGSTTDWGTRSSQTTQPFQKVGLDYVPYSWILLHSKFQELRNKNAGEFKMFDMAMEQFNEVKQSAMSRLMTHSYGDGTSTATGDAPTAMLGLEAIIDDDNTYAGIARGTYSWMQANVDTQAAATFTADDDGDGETNGIAAMKTLWLACSAGKDPSGGIKPDLAEVEDAPSYTLCDDTRFLLFGKCMAGQRLYTSAAADPQQQLTFMGKPVYRDSKCTASRFYFINNNYLQIDCVHPALLNLLVTKESLSPYGVERMLGTQLQMYSRNPRYLGSLQLT
jgi:hypothetical protein